MDNSEKLRRVTRANVLLAELGGIDILDALEELKRLRDAAPVVDKTVIKRLAVQTGFTLKEETPDGPDLKPYVYDFARAVAQYATGVRNRK